MKQMQLLSGTLLGLSLWCLAGCEHTELPVSQELPNHPVILKATAETHASTRSAVDNNGKFSWLAGDKIWVETGDAEFSEFTYQGEKNFSGNKAPRNNGYAVSPVSLVKPKMQDGMLSLYLPEEYNYSFSALDAIPSYAPMVGKIEENNSVNFKNLTALLRLHLTNISKKGCKIVITSADQQLAGLFFVRERVGAWVINRQNSTNDNKLTITYDAAGQEQTYVGQYFFIPIPVSSAEETDFTVDVYNQAEPGSLQPVLKETTLTINGPINRGTLYILPPRSLPTSTDNATDYSSVTDSKAAVGEINNAITNAGSSPIQQEVAIQTMDADMTLPSTIPDGSSLSFSLEAMPVGPRTISSATSSASTRTGTGSFDLTFRFPDGRANDTIIFNTPRANLTLDITQRADTLSVVDATTAGEITVNEGVTIEKLIISNHCTKLILMGKIFELEVINTASIEDIAISETTGELGNKEDFSGIVSNYDPDSSAEDSTPVVGGWEDDE